jgi:hypothetical protein
MLYCHSDYRRLAKKWRKKQAFIPTSINAIQTLKRKLITSDLSLNFAPANTLKPSNPKPLEYIFNICVYFITFALIVQQLLDIKAYFSIHMQARKRWKFNENITIATPENE